LVELFNNTDAPVDITNWCVYHSSASGKTKDKLACFEDADVMVHILIGARSYALVSSAQLGITGDLVMTKGLGGAAGGHVYIVDSVGTERDSLGWGAVDVNSEGLAVASPISPGYVLERKQTSPGVYVDSNNNNLDFFTSTLRSKYVTGAISEVVDVCKNISGIQVLVPSGDYTSSGDCLPIPVDLCPNLADIQNANWFWDGQ
jgi:hypothetical protein